LSTSANSYAARETKGNVEMKEAAITTTCASIPFSSTSDSLNSLGNARAQVPPVTGTCPSDPQNLTLDSATYELSHTLHQVQSRQEEAKQQATETTFRAEKQQQAVVAIDVASNQSPEELAPPQQALAPVPTGNDASVSKAAFEADWDIVGLERLVDAASTEQLLTLLSKLDERPFHSRMSFHNVSFQRNGVQYLRGVNGVIEPGKLTALIGSPDSGITLLLSLLAGRSPLFGKATVNILYDGQPISAVTRKAVGYVVKDDPNLPQFTVYETLLFAARLRVADESTKLLRFRTLLWMKLLGLSHTYNTVVGDALTRGVSGGERRRVSYGCEMIAGQSLVLADLPTNGLDSTSAFALIKNVTSLCRTGRGMLVSIVQPSPEILDLFDSIMIMSKGAVLYCGPPGDVESFFSARGFERPLSKTLPDWVEEMSATPERFWVSQIHPRLEQLVRVQRQKLDLLSPKHAQGVDIEEDAKDGVAAQQLSMAEATSTPTNPATSSSLASGTALDASDLMPPLVSNSPSAMSKSGVRELWSTVKSSFSTPEDYVNPDDTLRGQAWQHLVRGWLESDEAATIQGRLDTLPRIPSDSAITHVWQRYPRSFVYQLLALFQRQLTLTFRNRGIWLGNIIQAVVMGLLVGTLFYQIPLTQAALRVRFGLLFFSVLYMGMGTAQMIPVHFQQRSTFYNQRQNGYYSSAAYYFAAYLTQLPVGAAETFLLSIIPLPAGRAARLHQRHVGVLLARVADC
jgi:ABC-type multidrug transport system ATPase subunit